MKLFKTTYLLTLVILLLLAGCSGDNILNPGGNTGLEAIDADGNVTFHIGATRGVLEPATDDAELIQSYMIVVAEKTAEGNAGNIVKVLKATSLVAAEMHAVKARLSVGTYKIYAFANIAFNAEGDWLYNKFVEGAAMPDLSTWYYGNAGFKNGLVGAIPMSNSVDGMDLEVLSDKGNTTYGIEVVRMMAKVELVFMNSSSDSITINKVSMGPLTTVGSTENGFIPLSWYDDASSLSLYSEGAKKYDTETYTHDISASPIGLAKGDVHTKPSTSFYVIESNPDTLTKQFELAFSVTHGSVTDEIRYALLDKSLVAAGTNLDGDNDRSPFIRRNDWLRVPIDLGDYELRLEANSYPPIGGYPEADIEEEEGGFKVLFKEPGEFSIRPSIRKYGTYEWIYLDDTSIIEDYTFTVTTEAPYADIFADGHKPSKDGAEIVGFIKYDVSGTALVTLTVKIKVTESVTRTLTRKMYITV